MCPVMFATTIKYSLNKHQIYFLSYGLKIETITILIKKTG